jgi:hypothetical protein
MCPQEGAHPHPVDDAPNVYTDHEFPVAARRLFWCRAFVRFSCEQVDLLWCAASLLKLLYPQLRAPLPDSDRGRVLVRLKAAHSMTQNAAAPSAPPVPQCRHARQPQHVPWRMQIDRTSKPESQAGGRAGDSERQCHPALRPTREGRCEGQPTDATDIEAPQTQFRGRSQALLYNHWRPHRSLCQRAPHDSEVLHFRSRETSGKIIAEPVLGGLHHVYRRTA